MSKLWHPGPLLKPLILSAVAFLGNLHGEIIGDGVADDTAALQQQLNEHGTLELSKGIYRISKPLEIRLDETGFAGIRGNGTARILMAGSGPAIRIVGTHGGTADPKTVRDEVWQRQRFPMLAGFEIVGDHAEADGIEATGTMQLTLSQLTIRKCRHAVHLVERNRNVLITECHFYENRGVGVYLDQLNLHQINITGCHISYNDGGGVVSRGGNVRNLQIGNCDIEGNHDVEGPTTANVLLDSTDGSIAEVAITGCTIQHTHKAPDSANIRILGGGTEPRLAKAGGSGRSTEGNVTITGNVMSDTQVNLHVKDARGVTVTGNTFWSGFRHDLLVENSGNVVVNGNNFDRNPRYIVNNTRDEEDNGLLIRDCADSMLTGNVVRGVWHKAAAVDVERCRRMQIAHNSILDCDGIGLRLKQVSHSVIADNIIRDDREHESGRGSKSLMIEGGLDNHFGANILSHGRASRKVAE